MRNVTSSKAMIERGAILTPIFAGIILLGALGAEGQSQTAQPARPVQSGPARPKPAQSAVAPQATSPTNTQGLTTAGSKADDVVARVGNYNLSGDDIRSYVAGLGPREHAAIAQDSSLLSQAVRNLLANRLVLQEVLAKKWDQQPEVAAQLDRVRETALVELYLETVSTPPANFPSDDELQKVYDANRGALLMPRQFQLAQIFVPVTKDADNATEERTKKIVDDIQRKLKGGADFASLANENSSKNGGDLGWLTEPQIRPEIRSQIIGLAKNSVSEPTKIEDGWHILKLIDTKASYTRTLPEVKEQLVQQIRTEQANLLRRAYVADLLKKTPPAINEIALSKVLDEGTHSRP